MSRVRAPSVTPIEQLGGTQVPLHCSGPGSRLGDAPLAQRQSNGLLIRRFWVRNPGGAPLAVGVVCVNWQQVCLGVAAAGRNIDVWATADVMQFFDGDRLLRTEQRTNTGDI